MAQRVVCVVMAAWLASGCGAVEAVRRPDPVELPAPPPSFQPGAPPPPPTTPGLPPPLLVAVLPVAGEQLSDDERALLSQLIAIRLERSGFRVADAVATEASGLCAEAACLPATASLQSADMALLVEHKVFGDAEVVTLQAWDRAQRRLWREAASTTTRGALVEALAPAVDAVVERVQRGLPPLSRPQVRERYEAARLDVCPGLPTWRFCDARGYGVSENAFVRRYREQTQRGDLDAFDVDREVEVFPWIMLGGSAALFLVSMGLVVAVSTAPSGQAFGGDEELWIIMGSLIGTGALAAGVYGFIELADGGRQDDGSDFDHLLDEATARKAVALHNAALLDRLAREPPGARVPNGLPYE